MARLAPKGGIEAGIAGNLLCYEHNAALKSRPTAGTATLDISSNVVTLLHNYPNPFNPTTWIRFETARHARAKIDIFNTRGARVRTFFDGASEPGTFVVEWDGETDRGRQVLSEIYFCRLISGNPVFQTFLDTSHPIGKNPAIRYTPMPILRHNKDKRTGG